MFNNLSQNQIIMNKYQSLLPPLKYALWMDIYAYYLENPKKSQWQVSLAFRVSKGTVWNAYRFMEKVI